MYLHSKHKSTVLFYYYSHVESRVSFVYNLSINKPLCLQEYFVELYFQNNHLVKYRNMYV